MGSETLYVTSQPLAPPSPGCQMEWAESLRCALERNGHLIFPWMFPLPASQPKLAADLALEWGCSHKIRKNS